MSERRSVSLKLTSSVIFSVLFFILITYSMLFLSFLSYEKKELVNFSKEIIHALSYSLSAAVEFDDKKMIEESLMGLDGVKEFVYVSVVLENSKLFYERNLLDSSSRVLPEKTKYINVTTPLKNEMGKVLGNVETQVTTHYLLQRLRNMVLKVIICTFLGILFMSVVILMVIVKFLRPLSKLKESIDIMSARKFVGSVDVHSNDEIGELAESFNAMSRNLKDTQFSRDRAELANSTKSQFLANMSHEIRTPMNAIIGFVDLLRIEDISDKQRNEYLEIIAGSGDLLLSIIDDILDISKNDSGSLELEHIVFNVEHVCEHVVALIRPRVQARNVKLNLTIDDDVVYNVAGDPTRLRQILINLLGNAVKFTSKGSIDLHVSLVDKIEDGNVELKFLISDTGIGISEDKYQHIFEPFSQADTSTTRRYGGTGLGLSICKMLVEKMRGRIWVDSTEGKGSVFSFTAVFKEMPAVVDSEIYPLSEKELKGLKFLVIDSDSDSRFISRLMGASCGFNISDASTLIEASTWIDELLNSENSMAVIMIELSMLVAEKDKAKQLVELSQLGRIKILATTTAAKVGIEKVARQNKADAFLLKPFTKSELINVVKTTLGDRRTGDKQTVNRHMASEFACKGLKVLVAEDNIINQKLMGVLLKNFGCEYVFAVDGQLAIIELQKGEYDIVLMDIMMPMLNGIEATKIIRRDISTEIPIVALTAAILEEDRDQCMNAGMNAFLTKPVQPDELKAILVKFAKRS